MSRLSHLLPLWGLAVAAVPSVMPMKNAADPGLLYPVLGLGTAGGSKDSGYAQYPEVRPTAGGRPCPP